jgi:hypothetical protein
VALQADALGAEHAHEPVRFPHPAEERVGERCQRVDTMAGEDARILERAIVEPARTELQLSLPLGPGRRHARHQYARWLAAF